LKQGLTGILHKKCPINALALANLRVWGTAIGEGLTHTDDVPMFHYSTDPDGMSYAKNERLGDAQGKYAAGNAAADKIIKVDGPR
jgi:hypothetical protein